jgi:hypothetical protein
MNYMKIISFYLPILYYLIFYTPKNQRMGAILPQQIRYTAFLASAVSGFVLLISLVAMLQIRREIDACRTELSAELGQFKVEKE